MQTVEAKGSANATEWGGNYRAASSVIATFAQNALWATGLPAVGVYKVARRYTGVDVLSVVTIRKLNRFYGSWAGSPLCQEVTSIVQEKHAREVERLKGELGPHSVHPQFSTLTSRYIHAFIRRLLGEMALPTKTERSLFTRVVCKASSIVDDAALKSAINFESLLLHFCKQLNPFTDPNHMKQLVETAIKSLGFSLGQQEKLDLHIKQHFAHNSPEEQFIVRIRWHEQNNSLPPGMPGSDGLTTDNLRAKLDSTLKMYLEGRMEQLLAFLVPESLKTGTAGLYYRRWGKDQLRGLLVYLMEQLVLNQVINPHNLSQTLLKILGEEVSDNDVNGYGRGQKKKVLETGQKMVLGALGNSPQFAQIFASSHLKASQMGAEAISQKNDTRDRLQACLAKLIYDKVKPEEYRHPDEWFKGTRAALSSVPVVGAVATGLHLACRTPFYAISYCFREAGQSEVSFVEWMGKHIVASQKSANYIAERLVALFHHPASRITALHLIEACIATLLVPKPQGQPIAEEMHLITKFLQNHFNIPLPFDVKKLSDLATQGIHGPFFQSLFPQAPLLEKLLVPLQPIIKELTLVLQVVEAARSLEYFEGDFTFWNSFVREFLNQQVACRVCYSESPTLSYIAGIRDTLVDQYLQMDHRALWTALSQLPPYVEIRQWNEITQARPDLLEVTQGFLLFPGPSAASPQSGVTPSNVQSVAAATQASMTECGVIATQ